MHSKVLKLGSEMLRFISSIDKLETPDALLDGLHKATHSNASVNVLGAALFPVRWGDWNGFEKRKTIFLHKCVSDAWWEEYTELTRKHPGPSVMFAQLSLAPFTLSEIMRTLEPLGIDRWPIDLAQKYGMRDSFNCPVGGRWVVTFWSPKVLGLSEEIRAVLFMGATFTAIRLQKLVGPQVGRIGKGYALTPRELSVLRLISIGHSMKEAASTLELGEETVRSHLKKAQAKLAVHDRSHAVAQALRLNLIP
ncbi:LuxR C-terminal-related transcriptional regulator [Hyphomicrobium sp. 99]|uniref:helix-turn-helix transcriptional regulator n=1 Tax=Hyphomicrobium sp. 99 TaxID=1163419 RepID=UPI0009E2BB57|nr:LuxR C-terminal-related transcriptional regulator [Hyphomicrobium sp. 99]